MELNANRPRLPALTSLRFFAALHVVIFHLYTMHITAGPVWYQRLSSIGYVGVGLFFVLSGFILVYTYAGAVVDCASLFGKRALHDFIRLSFFFVCDCSFISFCNGCSKKHQYSVLHMV